MMNYEMVLIESSKRSQGTSTQFQFKLPKPCRDVYKIDLLFASLNNTFYTFTSMDCFKFVESFPSRMTSVIIPAYNENVITYDALMLQIQELTKRIEFEQDEEDFETLLEFL